MTKKHALIIASILAVALVYTFWNFNGSHTEPEQVVDIEEMGTALEELSPEQTAGRDLPPPELNSQQPAGFLSTQDEDKKLFESYERTLKDLGACLSIKTKSLDQNSEVNFDNFSLALSDELGEVVTQTELWATTDLKTQNGEVRRILIEKNLDTDSTSVDTLSYWSYDSHGNKKELPLTDEQKGNPSESLVATLESDGRVIGGSMSRKVFYQNGDELVLVEKNGKMFSMALEHEGKIFSCSAMDKAAESKCECK